MLTIELTASQERALRRLAGILDEAGACYQFTGGFAGNPPNRFHQSWRRAGAAALPDGDFHRINTTIS